MRRRVLSSASVLAIGLSLTACGSDHGGSPTSPSTAARSTSSTTSGSSTWTTRNDDPTTPTSTVEGDGVVGTLITGTSCPTLQFTIGGYTLRTSATTQYVGGTCADIKAGSKLVVTGTKATSDTVDVTKIAFKTGDTPTPPTPPTVNGDATVRTIVTGTACPTVSFLVGDHNEYTINTTATTTYQNGTCADITPGAEIAIAGTKVDDHTVTATTITFKIDQPTETVNGTARIASLVSGTSCPTLGMLVGEHSEFTVNVTAATTYTGGTCSDLKPGAVIDIAGTKQSEHTVTATAITIRTTTPPPPPPHEVEGVTTVVSLVTGTSCPTLGFTVGEHGEFTVNATATTIYTGGTCADVTVGTRVMVKGTTSDEHTVTATSITIKP